MHNHPRDPAPTRASLLDRVRDVGDEASWREFHETYRGIILGFALNAGLFQEEAEDVVQETFLELARKMPEFRYDPARGSFKAWLLQLVRWRVINQFQKRPPVHASPPTAPGEATRTRTVDRVPDPASQDLDQVWNEQWALELLRTAESKVKGRVDPRRYQIFDLCAKKELPPQKVAEAFGISLGQVYLAKHRVTQMIKAEVRRLDAQLG
jgi:RNA polymerase sigma factor (sigma-70 family)